LVMGLPAVCSVASAGELLHPDHPYDGVRGWPASSIGRRPARRPHESAKLPLSPHLTGPGPGSAAEPNLIKHHARRPSTLPKRLAAGVPGFRADHLLGPTPKAFVIIPAGIAEEIAEQGRPNQDQFRDLFVIEPCAAGPKHLRPLSAERESQAAYAAGKGTGNRPHAPPFTGTKARVRRLNVCLARARAARCKVSFSQLPGPL